MKEYKKTKRTHFQGSRSFQLRMKIHRLRRFLDFDFCSLIFDMILSKRTQFPHFSTKNRRHQNLYTCIPVSSKRTHFRPGGTG